MVQVLSDARAGGEEHGKVKAVKEVPDAVRFKFRNFVFKCFVPVGSQFYGTVVVDFNLKHACQNISSAATHGLVGVH